MDFEDRWNYDEEDFEENEYYNKRWGWEIEKYKKEKEKKENNLKED